MLCQSYRIQVSIGLPLCKIMPHATRQRWVSLQADSYAGILSPTDSNRLCTWLYYCLTHTCFHCSSAYLHRCISWLTARSRVNIYIYIYIYIYIHTSHHGLSTQMGNLLASTYAEMHSSSHELSTLVDNVYIKSICKKFLCLPRECQWLWGKISNWHEVSQVLNSVWSILQV